MSDVVSALGGFGLLLVIAPLVPGVATRTRAVLTGRRGATVWQTYSDVWKLVRRGTVYSRTATAPFRLVPVATLAAVLAAATLVPLDGRASLLGFSGDFVAFAYVLALGRFVLVLGALDTGSSFEGMGASREVTFASFAEPALFLCFITLVLATGQLSLSGMLGAPLLAAWPGAAASLSLAGLSLFVLLLVENSRVPADDPATHLELTMIHEVIVLDHSGLDLAFLLYGSALKLALFGALVTSVFVPRAGLAAPASIAVLLMGLVVVSAAVGVVESTMARLRLPRVPQLLAGAGALAFFGLVLLLR